MSLQQQIQRFKGPFFPFVALHWMGRFDFTFSHTFYAQVSDSVMEGMSSMYQVIDRLDTLIGVLS